MTPGSATRAALAAHRFGLGEAELEQVIRGDPQAWLSGQIGAAEAQRGAPGESLPTAAEGLRRYAEFVRHSGGNGARSLG
jgi:uncharacterized protein (DUF1800 family)